MSRSVTTRTVLTSPNSVKRAATSSSVAVHGRFPTNSFFNLTSYACRPPARTRTSDSYQGSENGRARFVRQYPIFSVALGRPKSSYPVAAERPHHDEFAARGGRRTGAMRFGCRPYARGRGDLLLTLRGFSHARHEAPPSGPWGAVLHAPGPGAAGCGPGAADDGADDDAPRMRER